MDIIQKIESALDGVIQPFFGVPEFGAGDEPERYVIVNFAEKPANFSESKCRVIEYFVSLNVFSEGFDFPLYEKIRAAMECGGFDYVDGGNVGDDRIFPYSAHYYLDFLGVIERSMSPSKHSGAEL